jgi:hypothetical protein
LAGSLNYLDIVNTHYAFAVHIDQLLVQYIAGQQHLALAAHKGSQVKDVGIQAHTVFAEVDHTPTRKKKITPAITGNQTGHGWVVVGAKPNDYILDSRHTLTFEIANRATQQLRQIKH